jgi:hypothetical protein
MALAAYGEIPLVRIEFSAGALHTQQAVRAKPHWASLYHSQLAQNPLRIEKTRSTRAASRICASYQYY